jgi:hypothetical protein
MRAESMAGDALRLFAGSVELGSEEEDEEQARRTALVLRNHAALLENPRPEIAQAVPGKLAELAAAWTMLAHPLGRIYGAAAEIAAQVVLDLALEPAESTRLTQPGEVSAAAGQA